MAQRRPAFEERTRLVDVLGYACTPLPVEQAQSPQRRAAASFARSFESLNRAPRIASRQVDKPEPIDCSA